MVENGAGDASLRRLADGLGVTHAALIQLFGSKEALFLEVVGSFRRRQRELMADTARGGTDLPVDEVVLATWKRLTSRRSLPMIRIVFDLVGVGLRDPGRVDGFLTDIVDDWTSGIRALLVARGTHPDTAAARATWVYAALRGLLLDLVTTGQRARVERGVVELAATLNVLTPDHEGNR
jgi:AcrR family transcriptional regulator